MRGLLSELADGFGDGYADAAADQGDIAGVLIGSAIQWIGGQIPQAAKSQDQLASEYHVRQALEAVKAEHNLCTAAVGLCFALTIGFSIAHSDSFLPVRFDNVREQAQSAAAARVTAVEHEARAAEGEKRKQAREALDSTSRSLSSMLASKRKTKPAEWIQAGDALLSAFGVASQQDIISVGSRSEFEQKAAGVQTLKNKYDAAASAPSWKKKPLGKKYATAIKALAKKLDQWTWSFTPSP